MSPLPPNRTGDFLAYGSPVSGVYSETEDFECCDSLLALSAHCPGCGQVEQPGLVEDSSFEAPQHTFGPHCVFDPLPFLTLGFSLLFRLFGGSHFRQVCFTHCVPCVSTFLRPLAPAVVTRLRAVRLVRAPSRLACATMDALTPARVRLFDRFAGMNSVP